MHIQKTENFNEILSQIQTSKQKAYAQINTTLVELYWNIGICGIPNVIKNHWIIVLVTIQLTLSWWFLTKTN